MFELNLKINKLLFINLLLVLACLSLACFYIKNPGADAFEHMRASLMVYEGRVPYKDFFEHHNSLLWYLFGWIINLFNRNSEIAGVLYYITYLFFLIGVFYVYKIIVRFMGNTGYGLIAVMLVLLPADLLDAVWLYYMYFRPDNYMIVSIIISFYYFFSYIENKKRKDLNVSYFWLWVSFLFIQKALIFYPVIGLMTLYMLYKKDMTIKDFLYAISIPLVGSLIIVGYFYYEGILGLYWKSCFLFNTTMREIMEDFAYCSPWFWAKIVFYVAMVGYVLLFRKENIYFRLWGGIFVLNLMFKCFYFGPHHYYFYETYLLAVPIAVISAFKLIDKYKWIKTILCIEILLFIMFNMYCLVGGIYKGFKNPYKINEAQEFIIRATNRCDGVIAEYVSVYNDNLGYYWFLRGHLDKFGAAVGLNDKDDINKLIEEYKPQLVFVDDIYDKFEAYKGNKVVIHKFDMDMIKKYYKKTIRLGDKLVFDLKRNMYVRDRDLETGFYELKPEYQKLKGKCIYNKENKKWMYEYANKTIISKD